MGMPAAVVGDMMVCTLSDGPKPHVGGPITPLNAAVTVFVMGRPAATAGTVGQCVGPPNPIAMGSMTVLFMSKPAARVGDTMSHGGKIVGPGALTVLVG